MACDACSPSWLVMRFYPLQFQHKHQMDSQSVFGLQVRAWGVQVCSGQAMGWYELPWSDHGRAMGHAQAVCRSYMRSVAFKPTLTIGTNPTLASTLILNPQPYYLDLAPETHLVKVNPN